MEAAKVSFLLSGENFKKDKTSLHDLMQAYEFFEGVIDCTYSNAAGIARFSESDRSKYQIIIKETKDNSWDTFFDIIIASSPLLFGNPLTPIDLLATIKATFEFLKCVYKVKNSGEKYSINNDANGTINVVTENGNQYNFNAPISINLATNAKDMLPEIAKMIDLLEKGVLDKAELQNELKNKVIELVKDDTKLFSILEKPGEEKYEFEGEIYRYNKRSRTGRLQVKELQELPTGNYTFRVFDSKIQDDVIISMIKKTTPISVRPIVIDDPITNKETIHYLEILDV